MYISREERDNIIRELTFELHGHLDGSKKNLLIPTCPVCGKTGSKFGIYIGPDTERKKTFMAHCFKCGATTTDLNSLLDLVGRPDLKVEERASFEPLVVPDFFSIEEDEIDDELVSIEMPAGWKRCFRNGYLKSRGFLYDDYEYFPVGTTRGLNFKYDNYVVFPIIDNEVTVGYVSRHIWPKEEIDNYNERARWAGKYEIRRYNNSTDNDFIKLLYNYDSVIEDVTDTVILCEGVFDVIALTRKLDLYDNHTVVPVCTFGKKISQVQIYKLQAKGVKTVIVAYDSDARDAKIKAATELSEYFDVFISTLMSDGKDYDEADFWDIYDSFTEGLLTLREYRLQTI